jgi:hypothetical protein
MEISTASRMESPFCIENIPKAKETDKYPRQIGIPSLMPFKKLFCSFIGLPPFSKIKYR